MLHSRWSLQSYLVWICPRTGSVLGPPNHIKHCFYRQKVCMRFEQHTGAHGGITKQQQVRLDVAEQPPPAPGTLVP